MSLQYLVVDQSGPVRTTQEGLVECDRVCGGLVLSCHHTRSQASKSLSSISKLWHNEGYVPCRLAVYRYTGDRPMRKFRRVREEEIERMFDG